MTRDEIISMAKEAGMALAIGDSRCGYIERFAALVAAKERERERERFALECIDLVAFHGGSVEIAAAIRARSQQ